MQCIFCKIISGEIPSVKVFEDETALALLDVNPITKGHCLVIPKQHCENIFDIDKNMLQKISVVAKDISEKMKRSLGATGVNLVNASGQDAEQSVFHFHVHVVPRYLNDGLHLNDWWQGKVLKMEIEELKALRDKIV